MRIGFSLGLCRFRACLTYVFNLFGGEELHVSDGQGGYEPFNVRE